MGSPPLGRSEKSARQGKTYVVPSDVAGPAENDPDAGTIHVDSPSVSHVSLITMTVGSYTSTDGTALSRTRSTGIM